MRTTGLTLAALWCVACASTPTSPRVYSVGEVYHLRDVLRDSRIFVSGCLTYTEGSRPEWTYFELHSPEPGAVPSGPEEPESLDDLPMSNSLFIDGRASLPRGLNGQAVTVVGTLGDNHSLAYTIFGASWFASLRQVRVIDRRSDGFCDRIIDAYADQ